MKRAEDCPRRDNCLLAEPFGAPILGVSAVAVAVLSERLIEVMDRFFSRSSYRVLSAALSSLRRVYRGQIMETRRNRLE